MDRRNFLKATGVAAIAVGAVSAGAKGYSAAKSPYTHTGWEKESIEPGDLFDRAPFEIDAPKYNIVGELKKINMYDYVFGRRDALKSAFEVPEGMEFEEYLKTVVNVNDLESTSFDIVADLELKEYYKYYYDVHKRNYLADDIRYYLEVRPMAARNKKNTFDDFALHRAFYSGISVHGGFHKQLVATKESDFEGVADKKYEVKDPAEMSKLIKKVATLFGSPIVRITKVNPLWAYEYHPGGRGYARGEKLDIPEHWQYAIVLGSPHEWESARSNPSFGHSLDGYSQSSIYAARLSKYIKELGYPARENSPQAGYEFVLPPVLIDAGVGEQGRYGCVITPEFGGNFRPSIVVTNLPLEPDKPIDINIRTFCESCKICAEQCPSGSVSFDGPQEVNGRGYDGWTINTASCHNFWTSVPGSSSCRICLIVCPYSKKSNWLHTFARDLAVRDSSGITASTLTWMEKNFYGEHEPEHYVYKEDKVYGTYRNPPWWFDADRFLSITK